MTSCVLEVSSSRKNKISLQDYDYQRDIQNRLLLSQFTQEDLEVLEEILYSPLQFPLSRLTKNLSIELDRLLSVLKKFDTSGLFTLQDDILTVDKEKRKYFELQMQKFDEDFQPGMEFLQSLLKKVPIHILPIWYATPRTSNNIFESLIEKVLKTPVLFRRYIMELNFGEPVLHKIIQDVYTAENFEISAQSLMDKYQLTRELFEEYMLHLEFSFVCCLGYRKNGSSFEEKVTPFHEWREYLTFLRDSEVKSIKNEESIERKRPHDFSFVQDLAVLLREALEQPIPLITSKEGYTLPTPDSLKKLLPYFLSLSSSPEVYEPYIHHLIAKLQLVHLVDTSQSNVLKPTENAIEWLDMRLDNQSLYFYRHPHNQLLSLKKLPGLSIEKAIKESEKCLTRAIGKGWIFFEDFFKGIHVSLDRESPVSLTKVGKNWKYTLPVYSAEEKELFRLVIFEWLFEAGLVQPGTLDSQDCFRLTSLGQALFTN